VRDDLDAGRAGALQHRFEHLRVVRHDADHVDALRDQILDRAHLQRRIGARRPDHERLHAELLGPFPDPGVHRVEPRNAADFHDDSDHRLVGRRHRTTHRENECGQARAQRAHEVS